jgi:hypothetical protein
MLVDLHPDYPAKEGQYLRGNDALITLPLLARYVSSPPLHAYCIGLATTITRCVLLV